MTKKMKTKTTTLVIENLDHLPISEQMQVRNTFEFVQGTMKLSLKVREQELMDWARGRGWFVYRGGSHLALHRRNGDPLRVVFVTEDSPR